MKVRSKYESPLVLDKIEIVECTFRKKMNQWMDWNWEYR